MDRIKLNIILGVLAVVSIGLIIYCDVNFETDNVKIDNESISFISEDWSYVNETDGTEGDVISLPCKIKSSSNASVLLINTLDTSMSGKTLLFKSVDQLVNVYVGGNLIYGYGNNDKRSFGKTPGSAHNFVELPVIDVPAQIIIAFKSPYSGYSGNLPIIAAGSRSACLIYMIKSNILQFLLCIILFIAGAALFVIYIYTRRISEGSYGFMYLSIFSILCFVYSVIETGLIQLFYGNQSVISVTTFLSIMLAPIPMALYAGESFLSKYKKQIDIITIAFAANLMVQIVLQVSNTADFLAMSVITHIMILMSIFFALVCTARIYRTDKNSSSGYALLAFSVLLVCVIGDIILSYMNKGSDFTRLQRFGLLFYVIILSRSSIGKIAALTKVRKENESLKQTAYFDEMTGFGNKLLFEKVLEEKEINLADNPEGVLGVLLFEINDLRKINDRYGYAIGNKIIALAAGIIFNHMDNIGEIFRIAGGEFAVVIPSANIKKAESLVECIYEDIKSGSSEFGVSFVFAYGSACYDENEDFDLHSTFVRADTSLYFSKRKILGGISV